jgi:hypothetical protein
MELFFSTVMESFNPPLSGTIYKNFGDVKLIWSKPIEQEYPLPN